MVSCTPKPDFDSVYTRIAPPQLIAGKPIPAPNNEIILTVSGKVGITNTDQAIVMDRDTIEAVGLVEYQVNDPYEEVDRTFTGVLMRDLLDLWQVPVEATSIHIAALNDYSIDIPLDLVRDYPVILALKQDGEYMTPDYRGPAMLVFPYDDYSFEESLTNSYWVWQITSMTLK